MSNDDWLHVSGSVQVELAGLEGFAAGVDAERDNVVASREQGIDIFDGLVVPFGGAGLEEGLAFGMAHMNCLGAAMNFLMDLDFGLTNVSTLARDAALEYGSTDAFSRMTLDWVEERLRPIDIDELPPAGQDAVEQGRQAAEEVRQRQEQVLDAGQSDENFEFGDAAGGYPQVIGAGTPGEYAIGPDEQNVRQNPSPPFDETVASPVGDADMNGGQAANDAIDRQIREQELTEQYQDAIARGADHHG